jgi:hypothetical protein
MSSPVSYLGSAQLRTALAIRDLSDPGQGPHAIQILIDRAVEALSRAWSCEVRWCGTAAAGWKSESAGSLIRTCSPRRDWPTVAAWRWAWVLTGC